MDVAALIREINDQLNRIFRHMLPGLVILGAARASHPSWFLGRIDFTNAWEVAMLAAVAITLGNLWYILHRYSIHQLLDVARFAIRRRAVRGYLKWLFPHIAHSFALKPEAAPLNAHVQFRSAQVILLFISAEALLFFTTILPPEPVSLFSRHRWLVVALGGVVLLVSHWQYWISNSLDIDVVNRFKRSDV